MRVLSYVCFFCAIIVGIMGIKKDYEWQQQFPNLDLTQALVGQLAANPMPGKDGADFSRGMVLGEQLFYEAVKRARIRDRRWHIGIAGAFSIASMLLFSLKRDE